MSVHENIIVDLHKLVTDLDADMISATACAQILHERYSPGPLDPRIAYTSIEGLKAMARKVLAGRFGGSKDDDDDDAEPMFEFAGRLQDRYPAAHKVGGEKGYKRLDVLTEEDVLWNIRQMDKAITGLTQHRNALMAWWQDKKMAA